MIDEIGHNCGIAAVFNSNSLIKELYLVGSSLQHRGREAAGISVVEDGVIKTFKGEGTINEVFNKHVPDELKSESGIFHTRYSTTHVSGLAQPLSITEVAIAHNGNLINVEELSKKYKASPDIDSWFILKMFEEENGDLYKGAKRCFEECKGSYNLVALNRKGEIAILRDEYGFHPLFVGKKGETYYAASEDIALNGIGVLDTIEEVKPGEVIIIGENGFRRKRIKDDNKKLCFFEMCYFAHHLSFIGNRMNNEIRMELGRELARKYPEIAKSVDFVAYIPNSGSDYGKGFAKEAGKELIEIFAVNRALGRTFISPENKKGQKSEYTRFEKSYHKLVPAPELVKGKKIAVADDSIVRSNVIKAATKRLFECGVKEVYFIIGVPPIKYPCFYGIDFPTREELIAGGMDENEEIIGEKIAQTIVKELEIQPGKIKIYYNGLDTLAKVLCDAKMENHCCACLTGNYPVK